MPYFEFFETRIKHIPQLDTFSPDALQAADQHYRRAIDLNDAGDLAEAISEYERAIGFVPVFWEALDNQGLCYMRLGNFTAAIKCFERSTQINSDSPLALVALIKCYRESGSAKNAFHISDYCIKRWPDKSPFPDWAPILGTNNSK